MPRHVLFLLALIAVASTACGPVADISRPIPTVLAPAPAPPQRLVVVLPGRGDDLDLLQRRGVVEAIQSAWPDADVMLTELSMGFYRAGGAPARLHREVIAPARQRGYREIWLLGASLGGLGSLLYEQAYPGEIDGIVLLAPYLGDRSLWSEIADAGGLAQWDAGSVQPISADTWQRQLWRHLKAFGGDPDTAARVWLAYGERDRLRASMPLLASVLRPDQVLVRRGGHSWKVWAPATAEIMQAIAAGRDAETGAEAARGR